MKKASIVELMSYTEFVSKCEIVRMKERTNDRERNDDFVEDGKEPPEKKKLRAMMIETIDFRNACATASDAYGAYCGMMRSGLWDDCKPILEVVVIGNDDDDEKEKEIEVFFALECEPNRAPEPKRNGQVRMKRKKTRAYVFALSRGLIDERFLRRVANKDGNERLVVPGNAKQIATTDDNDEVKEYEENRKLKHNNNNNNNEDEQKVEEFSKIVVTIDSDGTTTAMRVSENFLEPEELQRKEDDYEDNDLDAKEAKLFGEDDDENNGNSRKCFAVPAGALAFSDDEESGSD